MRVERASARDARAVEALLTAVGLPLEGASDALALGVVARDGATVIGAAAIEPYGEAGLLRSVVVAEAHRGTGIGRHLVAEAAALARDLGIRDLYLLTETAADWFALQGFQVVPRDVAREAVGASVEFTMVCATSGVPMRRALG